MRRAAVGSISSRAPFALLLAAALAAFVTPSPAAAQGEKRQVEVAADGSDLFRALLDRRGIKPIKYSEINKVGRWDDVIVIMLGSTSGRGGNVGNAIGYVQTALRSRGAGLVASDTSIQLGWAQDFNAGRQASAEIQMARVECSDKDAVLVVDIGDGNPRPRSDCPFVVPLFGGADAWDAPNPDMPIGRVFGGLNRIATNKPSYITTNGFAGEFRYPLARFPEKSFNTSGGFRQALPKGALFALGGQGEDWNEYHFLAMADGDVFINQMLIEPGTDNLELAYRTIEFLQGPTRRKRCLFIENGRVIEEFDGLRKAFASQKPSGIPNPAAAQKVIVEQVDRMLDRMQTENVLNNTLLRSPGFRRIMWLILVLLAIRVTFYLLQRWGATKKPTDQPPPPTVAGVPAGPPGVFDRRQKELLRRDNLYEPVRDLVREFFVALGIHGDQGPRHPKVVVSDAVRKPESLRQAIRDFWKLAYGPPQEVTVGRWRELEPYFNRLREAHADGKWRFEMPGAPVAAPV